MKLTKYAFLLIVLVAGIRYGAHSQAQTFTNSIPVKEVDYTNVIGFPYLYNEWYNGSATLADGKIYHNVQVKYNEKDDELYFKGSDDQPMKFTEPVRSFTIVVGNNAHTFKQGFNGPGFTREAYLEVLAEGKVKLLKRISKSIIDNKEYASAETTRRFMEVTKYLLAKGDEIQPVKREVKSLIAAIGDKQEQLTQYAKDNKLNGKSDEELIKLVNYYNSL
jgi:hypothetical protein